jgi:hypothetical protein
MEPSTSTNSCDGSYLDLLSQVNGQQYYQDPTQQYEVGSVDFELEPLSITFATQSTQSTSTSSALESPSQSATSAIQPPKKRQKNSPVWKHFKENDIGDEVLCLLCSQMNR